MWDTTQYPYLTANPRWVCAILGTPLAVVVCVSPLCFSKIVAHRRIGLTLSGLALFMGLIVWLKFLGVSYN
jgi:hypothetical protein